MVGTTIEFFDFYIYATAAVFVFPKLFFPSGNQTASLLASFAVFGVAFVARPVGSVLFGHFGDRIGRKATLVGSLLTMGIATFVIGLLPTFEAIGYVAPILLALLRFCQGVGLGGEWSGAALLATETAEEGKRGWAAMWPQLGAPLGFLLANGVYLAMMVGMGFDKNSSPADHPFYVWGWRVPFLASAVMVIVGLYVRLRLAETPVFTAAVEAGEKVRTPLAAVLRTSWRPLILGTFIMLATYTLFYLMTAWASSYGTQKSTAEHTTNLAIAPTRFIELQLIAVLFFAAFIPVSGRLADRMGRKPVLIAITIGIIAFGFTFNQVIGPDVASEATMLGFLIVGMTLMGLTFGPMSAVLPELFPTNVRYTGSGISYNVASILGAAVAPFIATALAASHGVGAVGIYLAIAGAITLVALILAPETRDVELTRL
ncbi:MFS transporter [Gordonia araii]|nr:MFS transporter [Gordonia araii]NNG97243.1 MHS family MFS transporter [Gordonia araii NBRC 100433]